MAFDLEQEWLDRKNIVETDIAALLTVGVPYESAKRLAGWNPTLDFDTYAEVSQFNPPAPFPTTKTLRAPASVLVVSESSSRWTPVGLNERVLRSDQSYSVFINDAPDVNIVQVRYYLDNVLHRTENALPWDFNGTAGGGDAITYSFTLGEHSIEAQIDDDFGTWTVEATFEVV